MAQQLKLILEDVLDRLEDAQACASEMQRLYSEQATADLDEHLDVALSRIDDALGMLGDPGTPHHSVDPATLHDMAELCVRLADESLTMLESGGAESDLGARLKSLRELISRHPQGYRELAGLTNGAA